MKPYVQNRKAETGGVLVITLVIACLSGFFLFSYLNLAHNQRAMVARSQSWNHALALAEAGVEEALAQLNPGAPMPTIDRTANGWGTPSGNLYGPMLRAIPGGNYSVVYSTETFPTIYATGYVAVPSSAAVLKRVVSVTTTNRSLFGAAMVAKLNIDFAGNGVATDSFNSSDSNLSNNGLYDSAKASTNGDIASIAGIVNVGNGNVNGKVLLGPSAGNTIGANGVVSGGVENDFNTELEDVVVPQTNWLMQVPLAVPVTIGSNSYDYVFTSATPSYYQINNLSGNVYIGPGANVTLLINNNASPSLIQIDGSASNCGKLALFMNGGTFSLSGTARIQSGVPANFAYFGTTNNTTINIGGNTAFTGTIYAPQAYLRLGGGGSTTYDIVGSIVANRIMVNGHFRFHYDESLIGSPYRTGFIANSWREL